jgi:hypothetical protein
MLPVLTLLPPTLCALFNGDISVGKYNGVKGIVADYLSALMLHERPQECAVKLFKYAVARHKEIFIGAIAS